MEFLLCFVAVFRGTTAKRSRGVFQELFGEFRCFCADVRLVEMFKEGLEKVGDYELVKSGSNDFDDL